MAARATWTGTLTVGLLSVPVKLFTAVRQKSIAFNQVDETTGSRIRMQKVSEVTGELVASDHIVKGFDLGGGSYVIVDDDDLKAVAPAKSKEIAVDVFVPADQVPAVMIDASYLVGPGKLGAKPYALLARAMSDSDRVAIGKFVMRQKEYLAAVRSDGEHLTLSTLVFADEIVDVATADPDLESVVDVQLTQRELAMAGSLVDAMSDPWEPEQYQDTYRAAVMELIEAKADGRVLTVESAPARENVVDLASALEASVEAAQASRRRHPTARKVDPAASKPVKKAAARKSA